MLGILVLAAACGTPHTGAGGTGGGQVTSTSLPSGQSPPTGANQARPDGSVVNVRKLKWSRATPGPGNQLTVGYTVGGLVDCSKLNRVDVAETAQTVTVTVLVGQTPGAKCDGPQPMIAAEFETTVTLKAPLGGRTVADGAS